MALSAVGLVLVAVVVLVLRARRKRRNAKPAREASGCVVLEQNAWDACSVDDVHEPWARLATEPMRGFCGVAPGRHRIVTTTGAGDATLDFVVYPGEVLSWRLDSDRARWEPHDLDADTRAMLEGAPPSTTDLAWASVPPRPKLPGWLVHLRTTIGMASSRDVTKNERRESGEGIERIGKRFAKLVARAMSSDGEDDLEAARALGESLVGRALTRKQIRALVAPAREAGDKLAGAGDHDRATRVVALGLAVMPGHPELMVALGCALAARGEIDEAARALDAALERDRCLDAEDVARAMRARLDLKSRLGRSVRV